MENIADVSIVTVYGDTIAFILVVGLAFMFNRYRIGRDQYGDILFNQTSIVTAINAVSNGISYALHYQKTDLPHIVKMLPPSIAEISVLWILFLWYLYSDYRIYGSRDRVHRIRKYFCAPVLVFSALTVLNLFVDIMFSVDEYSLFTPKPLFYVMTFFQYFYGLIPIFLVIRYEKLHGRVHFFNVSSIVVPGFVAAIFTLLTDYSARALGFAVVLIFLHISHISKLRFEDTESGFYNRQYLTYAYELAGSGLKDYKSVIQFKINSPSEDVFGIIRDELPRNSDLIRFKDDTILLFSENRDSSMIAFFGSMIDEALEDYEKEHPDKEPIDVKVSGKLRKRDESARDFVKRVAGKKQK